jgi:MerR family copper efflux transcriptional regulator
MTTKATEIPSQTPKLLRIGDLSRLTGKTVRAIHLYEELGLLQPTSRTSGGFRLYEPGAVERVRWIGLFNGMGFSLQEMRELVHAWWDAGLGPEAMSTLRSLFKRKLEDTREAVRRSQHLELELAAGLSYLEACRVCAAPASTAKSCVGCQQDHGMEQAPALVAGLKSASPGRGPRRSQPVFVGVEEIQ